VRAGVGRGAGCRAAGGRAGVAGLILATEAELARCWRMVGALEALGVPDRAMSAEVADITRRFGELLAGGGHGR
jgi:hypothetical protein